MSFASKKSSTGGGFSSETQSILLNMAKTAGLTHRQIQELQKTVQSGQCLPSPDTLQSASICGMNSSSKPQPALPSEISRRPTSVPLRPGMISGGKKQLGSMQPAERERYIPGPPGRDRQQEKMALQRKMEFGGKGSLISMDVVGTTKPKKQKPVQQQLQPQSRFDELVAEVDERKQFLDMMVKAGKGKQYEPIIKAQIAEKLAEMESLDRQGM